MLQIIDASLKDNEDLLQRAHAVRIFLESEKLKWETAIKGRTTLQARQSTQADPTVSNEEEICGFQYSVSSPRCEPIISSNPSYLTSFDGFEGSKGSGSLYNSWNSTQDVQTQRVVVSFRPITQLPDTCRKKFVPPAPKRRKTNNNGQIIASESVVEGAEFESSVTLASLSKIKT